MKSYVSLSHYTDVTNTHIHTEYNMKLGHIRELYPHREQAHDY